MTAKELLAQERADLGRPVRKLRAVKLGPAIVVHYETKTLPIPNLGIRTQITERVAVWSPEGHGSFIVKTTWR